MLFRIRGCVSFHVPVPACLGYTVCEAGLWILCLSAENGQSAPAGMSASRCSNKLAHPTAAHKRASWCCGKARTSPAGAHLRHGLAYAGCLPQRSVSGICIQRITLGLFSNTR